MDKFEELGRRLDEELTRLRRYVEDEVAPETEKRTAQFLREVSEKLAEASQKLENRVASRGQQNPPATQTVTPLRSSPRNLLLFCAILVSGCGGRRSGRQSPFRTANAACPPRPRKPPKNAKNNTNVSPPAAPTPGKRKKTPPTPAPVGYTEEGNASWYGDPFNGRHSSNGEIYDMYKLTAAHRTLPFETMVRVTNLKNGKTTTVRITDRGPFVANRIIDLSLAAAREVESVGPGVVPVRLEVLGSVDVTAGFFTVQVGAFKDRANAERLRDRLSASYTPIFIQTYDAPDGTFYRVRVGKISGEEAAHALGEQLREKEKFTPFVVRLDDVPAAGVKP